MDTPKGMDWVVTKKTVTKKSVIKRPVTKKTATPIVPTPIVPHGPREAFYNNLPTQHPMIVCLCGKSFDGGNTWEDVGAEFDEHLEQSEGTREHG